MKTSIQPKLKKKDISYTIEWSGNQWVSFCSRYGRYSCFGVGNTPKKAFDSLLVELPAFKNFLKNTNHDDKNIQKESD